MRKTILILAALAVLAGCGKSSYQSLPHALAALRAGDYDDFQAAKRESEEQVKKAIQPGGDLCLASAGDFYTYQAQFALGRLDDRALFKLPEEDRFVYAMKIAGRDPGLEPGNFLEQAPIRRATMGETELGKTGCEKEQEKMTAALTSGNNSNWSPEERYQVLWEWQGDLKARHGAKFDEKMHDAVVHLDSAGYSAQWPADFQ